MNMKKSAICMLLVGLLLSTFLLIHPVVAEEPGYQNISVQQAEHMIEHMPNVVILDVRNQSEFALGRLFGAVWIPLHELEDRIDELTESQNDTIIVYCAAGGRSAQASQILVDNGFISVYNMLGGITEWVAAEYPIYTTFHAVTVDKLGDHRIKAEIEPLLRQIGCTSCSNQSQSCPDEAGEIIDIQSTIIDEGEDYIVILVTYEHDGELYEFTLTKNLLWSYRHSSPNAYKTANFTMTEMTNGNVSIQFFEMKYMVEHRDYNLTIATSLTPLDSETYNRSSTIINYVPAGKAEIISFETVEFNSPVTLSELYDALANVARKIGQGYMRDGARTDDAELRQLGHNYYEMARETSSFSRLAERQLQQYDRVIYNNTAILMDECSFDCWASGFVSCFGPLDSVMLGCLFGCAVASIACGPLWSACFAACGTVCTAGDIGIFGFCAGWALGDCCF
ncbi:MAG: rhodanese-like domain-containing protein [Candidatus Bathyarchaeia archaeon]